MGIYGYDYQVPYIKITYIQSRSLLVQPYAIYITIALDQFVISAQNGQENLSYVLGGVPIGKLSSIFRPELVLSERHINSIGSHDRLIMDVIPLAKEVVCCNYVVNPSTTNRLPHILL
jgi:hypothetical protein